MRTTFTLLLFSVFISCAPDLMACSYFGGTPAKSVSDLYAENDVVLRGTVEHIDLTDGDLSSYEPNRIAVLKGKEWFKSRSDQSDEITLHYIFAGDLFEDCLPNLGTHFVPGKEYTVFLTERNGQYHVVHTSGEYGLTYFYNHDQIYNYLKTGSDSELKTNFCVTDTLSEDYKSTFLEAIDMGAEYAECAGPSILNIRLSPIPPHDGANDPQ